jgi:hypothetical protein
MLPYMKRAHGEIHRVSLSHEFHVSICRPVASALRDVCSNPRCKEELIKRCNKTKKIPKIHTL